MKQNIRYDAPDRKANDERAIRDRGVADMHRDTDERTSLSDWLCAMTREGYEVIGSSVYTHLNDPKYKYGDREYHPNYPWQGMVLHLRRRYLPGPEIVFNAYDAPASGEYTCYAALCWPRRGSKVKHQLHGFVVPGTHLTERVTSNIGEMRSWVGLKTPPAEEGFPI